MSQGSAPEEAASDAASSSPSGLFPAHAEAAQSRLTAILEETTDVVGIATPAGIVTYLNRAGRRLLGVPGDGPLPARHLADWHAPGAGGVVREEGIPTALREGSWSGESALLLHDGREVPVSEVIVAHRAADGEVEYLSTVIRDVTPLKQAQDALRASEAELRALVEAISDVILVLDREGRYCKVGRSAADRLVLPADELVGKRLHDVFPREQADLFLELVTRALRTRSRVEAGYSLRIGGEDYRFDTTVCPLPDDDRVVWVARDVTERHRQQEALRESEERLLQSQKMEAVGRLAGGVAHDFNNLLTVIRGNTELMLLDLPPGSPLREDAEDICRAAGRAAELTHQLLAFSRHQVVQPRTLSLNRVVGGLEGALRRLLGEGVGLALELRARRDLVRADPGQMEQVVVNLVANARDALSSGGTIRIASEEVEMGSPDTHSQPGIADGPYVALVVSDDGYGMDSETVKRIFEPFFTTREQGKGTGLGLSTVYGIVRQNGGHVTVRSTPGDGATFTVLLPRVPEEEGGEPAPSGPAPA